MWVVVVFAVTFNVTYTTESILTPGDQPVVQLVTAIEFVPVAGLEGLNFSQVPQAVATLVNPLAHTLLLQKGRV